MRALTICILLLLAPLAQSANSHHQRLLELAEGAGLSITDDPDVLILGGADVALSLGPWSESQVHAFSEHHGYRPTMLPLTYAALAPEERDTSDSRRYANFYRVAPQQSYYLYVNLPQEGDWRENLGQQCAGLLDDDFQDQLVDDGFARLPPVNRQLWLVRLGVEPPVVKGGYL